MGVRSDTRQRMVSSAAVLLGERGVAGTSVAGVLRHSNGPRGSVGFHFPGGRTELLADALRTAGDAVTATLRTAARQGADPAAVYTVLCRRYRRGLTSTGFSAGCPIGAAMQEAHHDADIGPIIAAIVADWHDAFADLLSRAGHPPQEASQLATLAIGSLEGAIMLARVTSSPAAIDAVIDRIAPLLAPTG